VILAQAYTRDTKREHTNRLRTEYIFDLCGSSVPPKSISDDGLYEMMSAMNVRRFWVSGLVLVAAIALLPFSFHAERHLETATRVEGSQAETVREELANRFRSPFVDRVVLVIQGLPPADSEEGGQALETIVAALKEQPGVSGVVSYLELRDPIFLGRGGGTFVLVGLTSTDGPLESLVPKLHQVAGSLENQLRGRYPEVKLELTGEIPLNFDIRKASADDVRRGESLVIPATLALLLVAFGSFVAALIPLAVGQLAIATTLAITGLLAQRWHLSILVQNLATMLGLGLGIDYALLMVSRFREAISAGHDGPAASIIAARQAGRTLLISASTVAIGFLALLTVPISEIRSIGIAGFLVAGMSVLLTNTVVPAVLGLLGRRIDIGRMPFTPKLDEHRAARTGNRWRRWGTVIVAHPWLALFLAGTPLLLLAWQVRHLDTSLPRGDWLPKTAESVRALHTLEQMDRSGAVESLRLIVEFPTDSIAQTDAGWDALDRVTKRLASDPRSERVISITSIAEDNRASLTDLSRETRRTFMSSDGRAALIEVLPASSISLRDQVNWVRELRKTGAPALTGVPGATLLVGGIPALNADYESIIRDRFPSVTALVVGGTLLALLCGFRSIIAALKAIVLNLFSVAASFGALVVVFQNGHGSGFLGVPGGTGSVFPLVPIVTFAIVFGLSMDYEVFLVARVLEARRSGLSEQDAIPEGMARTAGLITSAAAIMIVVFAAFTFGDFLVVKMIGFTLVVAVLIDATLVRIVIGPALLRIAGDWNWWPGGLVTARKASVIASRA
jgi:putative drug exporter of the RND superfamily